MRAVAQRVHRAHVDVDGEVTGQIEEGLLVYLGAAKGDSKTDVASMVSKLAGLRIFRDPVTKEDKMSSSVQDIGGGVLVVSQFTLFGDVRRGRRPSFDGAAPPEEAERQYLAVVQGLRDLGISTETGRFRAMMNVHAVVDGPITIMIDSQKLF